MTNPETNAQLTPRRPPMPSERGEYVAASPRTNSILDKCDAKELDPEIENARARLKKYSYMSIEKQRREQAERNMEMQMRLKSTKAGDSSLSEKQKPCET